VCENCTSFAEIANNVKTITWIVQTASKLTEINMIVGKLNKMMVSCNCACYCFVAHNMQSAT